MSEPLSHARLKELIRAQREWNADGFPPSCRDAADIERALQEFHDLRNAEKVARAAVP